MTINQISIFLENRYGTLNEILTALSRENIRIIAATVADTLEFGIMRIIVSDPQQAVNVLKSRNVSANLTEVLAISAGSDADSFARTLSHFTKAGISIEYMYCFSAPGQRSVLILRTNNQESAREVIRRQNLVCISPDDLMNL